MSVNPEPIRTVEIGGQTLRVRHRAGAGRPLLLCSDFAANIEIMDDFCAAMSRPTVCFDGPGVANTARPRARRMPALARQAMALLDALSIAECDVLGMGWGGLLAQQIARDHDARIGRLVLVASSPGQTMLPGRLVHLRRLARRGGLAGLVADGRDARALFGGRRDGECEAVAGALARAARPSAGALAAQLYAVAGFSSLVWAHRIAAPTLVLAGDDDTIVPLANARLLSLLIARAELSVMHAAGHWLMIERQSEAIRRIEAFLALGDTGSRP